MSRGLRRSCVWALTNPSEEVEERPPEEATTAKRKTAKHPQRDCQHAPEGTNGNLA